MNTKHDNNPGAPIPRSNEPQFPVDLISTTQLEDLIPDPEIMASAGVYGTRMGWEEESGFELPGRIYASTTNCEFQDMLKEVRDNIDSYKLAKAPPAYIPNGAYPAPYAKASPSELIAIEHALAIMEGQVGKLEHAFKLGARSVRVATSIRYCPDCKPEERKSLRPRQRYCDKHRDQRRKATHDTSNRKRKLTTVTTVPPRKCGDTMKNKTKAPDPVEMVKRNLIGLAHEEKLPLYAAAEKLGIVGQQVNRWLYRDKEFRLMARAVRATYFVELLSEAVELLKITRPLTEREQRVIQIAAIYAAHPTVANFMVSAEEPEPRQMSVRDMQFVDRELEKARAWFRRNPLPNDRPNPRLR